MADADAEGGGPSERAYDTWLQDSATLGSVSASLEEQSIDKRYISVSALTLILDTEYFDDIPGKEPW